MKSEKLWKIEDVAEFLQKSQSWVYKRTAPNTRFYPKIPRIANLSQPRFDPLAVKALFSTSAKSSLKIEKLENHHSESASLQKSERKFRRI